MRILSGVSYLGLSRNTILEKKEWAIGIFTGQDPLNVAPQTVNNPALTAADVTDVPPERQNHPVYAGR